MTGRRSPRQLDRRRFIRQVASLAGALPVAGAWGCGGAGDAGGAVYWLSAHARGDDRHGLAASAAPHDTVVEVETGFRGHGAAQHPRAPGKVVLFGRRPGSTSAIVDLVTGRVDAFVEAAPGCAFQGHGFFTPDGRVLVTSEADMETARGKLVVRESDGFTVVDELDSYGLGPHEIGLMADGDTIVVANGGLLTRPETGREVLNLDTMDSTLAYVSLGTGALLEEHRVAESKSSIRHLALGPDGTVVFGIQLQREALDHDELVPLAGAHRRGQAPRLFEDVEGYTGLMNDYVGSVALSADARVAGFTSPRGNVALFWRVDGGQILGVHELVDCSGLAVTPTGEQFVLSSSVGEVRTLDARSLVEERPARRRFEGIRWDNHLIAVAVGEQT